MSRKIAIIVPNQTIKQHVESLFVHEVLERDLSVFRINILDIPGEVERLLEAGFAAVIARAGTYQELKKLLPIPVIEMPIQASDILFALHKAGAAFKNVFLLVHENVYFEHEECKNLLGFDFICKKYLSVMDLKSRLESIEHGPDTVVVGSGVCAEVCQAENLNTIDIAIQASAVLNAYEYAQNMLAQNKEEKRRLNLLESILYNVDDGVVIMEKSGNIKHFNRKSGLHLGVAPADAIGRNIRDFFPDVEPGRQKNNHIVSFGAKSLVLNINPFQIDTDEEQYIITINDVTQVQELEKNIRFKLARRGLAARYTFKDYLTREPEIKKLIKRAQSVAKLDASVIIYGESGTGKELFAQSIHNASPRKNGPFVAINCMALPETLLESELFGYVGGAFTGARKEGKIGLFETAHGGTLFLDEINSMSLALQIKLLRVIEQKEIMRLGSDYIIPLDVRVISASNKALLEGIAAGTFRQDLYFRLNHFEITLPPMAARPRDIIPLFRHFLAEHKKTAPDKIELDPEFESALLRHKWWGNVREIKNTALRYHIFGGDNSNGEILSRERAQASLVDADLKIDLNEIGKMVEAQVIQSLLDRGVNKSELARLLGISRQALYNKIAKLDL
ncbi:sigma 54-interacting transcriptional regulator [Desulfovibrio sp. OttesenSCG-928-C14]|nr:sigma 54-interacting transcriptional regulator [Desulfovibrio sp. OttesenSCG-928-C14]